MRLWAPFWQLEIAPRGVRSADGWFAVARIIEGGAAKVLIPGCRVDFFTACDEPPDGDVASLI